MSTNDLYESVKCYVPSVNSAYATIYRNCAFYVPKRKIRNDDIARQHLENATRMSEEGKYFSALDLYAQSLRKVEAGSELISIIFHRRAQTLEQTKYYSESLKDIHRIITGSFPVAELLRPSLEDDYRRLIYRARVMPIRLEGKVPLMPRREAYQTYPEISLKIHYQENGFVASTYIPAGTCLMVEEAGAIAPLGNYNLFCHECMKYCLNPIPCFGCTTTLYCQENCRYQAWWDYHRFECKILFALDKVKYRLAVKMALSLRKIIDADGYPDGYDDLYIDTDYIEALLAADTGPNISATTFDQLTSSAAQVFHAVLMYTNFFNTLNSPLKYDIFKGLLLKLMYVEATIASRVDRKYKLTNDYTLNVSYIAYFPHTSRVRTSCAPNASLYYHNQVSEIVTMRDIEPGEEITVLSDEYYHHTITEKKDRQLMFGRKYFDRCRCEACEKNWPLFPDLVARHSPKSDRINFYKQIMSLYFWILKYPLNPDIMDLCFRDLTMISMGRNWLRPSVEWFTFENVFRCAHALKWLSVHTVTDFMRKFPNSAQV